MINFLNILVTFIIITIRSLLIFRLFIKLSTEQRVNNKILIVLSIINSIFFFISLDYLDELLHIIYLIHTIVVFIEICILFNSQKIINLCVICASATHTYALIFIITGIISLVTKKSSLEIYSNTKTLIEIFVGTFAIHNIIIYLVTKLIPPKIILDIAKIKILINSLTTYSISLVIFFNAYTMLFHRSTYSYSISLLSISLPIFLLLSFYLLLILMMRLLTLYHFQEQNMEEENSKTQLLAKCYGALQTLSHPDRTIVEILEQLRNYYDTDYCITIDISKDGKTFSATHESFKKGIPPKLAYSQNKPIEMIQEWVDAFKNKEEELSEPELDLLIKDSIESDLWKKQGIQSAYVVGIYDKSKKLTGFLAIVNPAIKNRSLSMIHIVARFIVDYKEKLAMEIEFKKELATEGLTGLLNKIATETKIDHLLQVSKTGTFFIIDVDFFKNLNDSCGHSLGDKALIELADELKIIFRKEDVVGRIGGDEFVAFIPQTLTADMAKEKANIINNAFRKTYKNKGKEASISASIGVCFTEDNTTSFDDLYNKADIALYKAKHEGKNTACLY